MSALFTDPGFAIDLQISLGQVAKDTKWMRPHEICEDPQLFVEGVCRFDVTQGVLGDCWLLAACAAIAEHPKLIYQIVPQDQTLSKSSEKYTGKIVINIWQIGEMNPIIIDDMLPTLSKKLQYGSCKDRTEFWVPLVEKALAKYNGGYKFLESREIAEGLLTLTGYSTYKIDLMGNTIESIDNLFEKIKNELERDSLIICAGHLEDGNRASLKELRKKGRRSSGYHCFTVTNIDTYRRRIRIFNPWGKNIKLPNQERYNTPNAKAKIAAIINTLTSSTTRRGEMWMEMENFIKAFEEVCIANEKPSVREDKMEPATETRRVRGDWRGRSAAGYNILEESFQDNPQFLLEIDVTNKEKTEIPVLVELIQDMHRQYSPYAAGFAIHTIPRSTSNQPFETQERFSYDILMATAGEHRPVEPALKDVYSSCIVNSYFILKPKERYVVIAFTREARKERNFLLRVHTADAFIRLRNLPDVPNV